MAKKIIIGVLGAVLVGALAIGALDLWRGTASANEGERRGQTAQGQGRSWEATDLVQGNVGQGQLGSVGRGRQTQSEAVETSRGGNGRGGAAAQQQQATEPQPDPQADVSEWITYEGTIVALDDEGITIATASDGQVTLKLGPSWYWQEQDLSLQVGDEVSVRGFYDGDTFEVGQITSLTSGAMMQLRDADGRPAWSGRGRRGGQSS